MFRGGSLVFASKLETESKSWRIRKDGLVFSLFLHDLLDNHYVTARTGKLDSC